MIKVNVSGKIFEVDVNVLMRSEYFKIMIGDCVNNDTIFVKRSPHIFEHVLACLIDDNYKCPVQYQDELKYFLITHHKWYDPYNYIEKIIESEHRIVQDKFSDIYYQLREIRDSLRDVDDKCEKIYNKITGESPPICKRIDCNDECERDYNYCCYHYKRCSYRDHSKNYCDNYITSYINSEHCEEHSDH